MTEKDGSTPSKSIRFSVLRRSNGFSLLEVMVAMAILGLALVSIFQFFSVGLRSTRKASDYTVAIFHARALMDEAYALPELTEGRDTFSWDDGMKGEREIKLRTSSEDGKTRLYEIVVTVSRPPSGEFTLRGTRSAYAPE